MRISKGTMDETAATSGGMMKIYLHVKYLGLC